MSTKSTKTMRSMLGASSAYASMSDGRDSLVSWSLPTASLDYTSGGKRHTHVARTLALLPIQYDICIYNTPPLILYCVFHYLYFI